LAGIAIEGVARTFGKVRAIDDVSLAIRDGEFFTLLGPSGCGKTTLLRMVAGFCDLERGRILFGERRIDALPPHRRNAGMVFQNYAIFPNHTVGGNVAYGLKARNVAAADIERRVTRALKLVHLDGYAERWPHQLSGGQLQRVAIARALVIEPEVLLLDEPLSNLDAKLRLRLRDDLRRIIKKTGVTALYVTHDQAEAVVLGDRIGVMRDGKLLQMASADELYNRPADLFVANFTGASNLLAGRLLERDGEFGMVEANGGSRLRASLPASVAAGEAVKIAVRPENVRLGVNGAAEPNTFTAQVAGHRYQGTQTVYELDMLGGRLDALELGTIVRYPVGSQIKVVLPPDQCWAYPEGQSVEG